MRGRWFFSRDEDDIGVTLNGEGGAVSPARWRLRPEDHLGVPGLTHAALAEAGAGVLGVGEGRGFGIVPARDGL